MQPDSPHPMDTGSPLPLRSYEAKASGRIRQIRAYGRIWPTSRHSRLNIPTLWSKPESALAFEVIVDWGRAGFPTRSRKPKGYAKEQSGNRGRQKSKSGRHGKSSLVLLSRHRFEARHDKCGFLTPIRPLRGDLESFRRALRGVLYFFNGNMSVKHPRSIGYSEKKTYICAS